MPTTRKHEFHLTTPGDRLWYARVCKEYKRKDAARVIHKTPRALEAYERGTRAIDLYDLRKLAWIYEVPAEWVLCWQHGEPPCKPKVRTAADEIMKIWCEITPKTQLQRRWKQFRNLPKLGEPPPEFRDE